MNGAVLLQLVVAQRLTERMCRKPQTVGYQVSVTPNHEPIGVRFFDPARRGPTRKHSVRKLVREHSKEGHNTAGSEKSPRHGETK